MKPTQCIHLTLALAGAIAALLMAIAPAITAGEVDAEAAQELFVETYKCVRCHSVASADLEATSEKMKSTDLGGFTTDDVTTLTKFLRKEEVKEDGTEHKKTWEGSEEDLAKILAWVGSLEAAPEDGS